MHGTEIAAAGNTDWRQSLANAVRDIEELCRILRLPEHVAAEARDAVGDFPLLVPRSYLRRIRPGDPDDPLLRQVLPTRSERSSAAGYSPDPVGDIRSRLAPSLLQKYHGRVLLLVSSACAVHCRYCFRREYPYGEDARGFEHLEPAFEIIARQESIREVILSGGDPLARTDGWLSRLAHRLANIPHVETLRIHTRLPVVLPDRVSHGLCEWLTSTRLQPIVVLHSNHPNELVGDCVDAIDLLRRAGILLLNQSVLLRGINDRAETLANLSRRLVSLGVLPYYLHQLDRVNGSAGFETAEADGAALVRELRQNLPGYLVPRFVREVAGSSSKIPVLSAEGMPSASGFRP